MSLRSLTQDKDILIQVAEGDEFAFTTLFHRHRDRIFSVSLSLTRDVNLAKEIVSDVFLVVWKRRERLGAVENFEAYLFIIARNKAYQVLKRIAKQYRTVELTEMEHVVEENNVEELLAEKENSTFLNKAIEKLSPQQKKVYQLIKVEHMKREEAAKVLGIHPETIKYHLAEAMKSIRVFYSPSS